MIFGPCDGIGLARLLVMQLLTRRTSRLGLSYCRLDFQSLCQSADDFKAGEECSFLESPTQLAAAYFSFIREIVLRQPLGVSQAAQIRCEYLAQVHAASVDI